MEERVGETAVVTISAVALSVPVSCQEETSVGWAGALEEAARVAEARAAAAMVEAPGDATTVEVARAEVMVEVQK